MEDIQVLTQDFVNVSITKPGKDEHAWIGRRYNRDITVHELKSKLELVTGGSAATMKLKVYDDKGNFVCDLDNDAVLLGYYPIDDGMTIHVIDNFALLEQLDNFGREERYRLSEEEYQKKDDTLRSFLQRNKLGKYNEEEMNKMKEQQQKDLEEESKLAEAVLVGARCEVRVPTQGVRRGTVRYNGPLEGARGLWIGVQYDEPRGRNDGEVNGKRYFTCPPKYGGFVKPMYVTVGNFPEEDMGLEDEI